MSVDQSVSLDLDTEFACHLTNADSVFYFMREGVSLEIINLPKIKAMWAFVSQHFHDSGESPKLAILEHEFPSFSFITPESTPNYIVDRLKHRYQRNKVQDLTRSLADKSDEPAEAMKFLRDKFIEIEKETISQKNVWKAGDSPLFLKTLQEKILDGSYKGATFGFEPLDKFTGGLRPGQLGIIAARPKSTKTFFAIKAFIEQKKQGYKPLFYTLENTDEEINLRVMCMISGFPWNRAVMGDIGIGDWKMLHDAWAWFDSLGEHWIASPPMGERTVPELMLQADKLGADSVIISQFRYVESTKRGMFQDHEIRSDVAMALKSASNRVDHRRPILVEAQLNREKDLALTDTLRQVSDILFSLDQTLDMQSAHQVELSILDSRNTGYGKWMINYDFLNDTKMVMNEYQS